jgi:hypothetical protein
MIPASQRVMMPEKYAFLVFVYPIFVGASRVPTGLKMIREMTLKSNS